MKLVLVGVLLLILGGAVVFTQFKTPLSDQLRFDEPATLSQTLEVGATELHVRDLEGMKQFYTELVGLEVISEDENHISLGFASRPVLTLTVAADLAPPQRSSAGLYHNAIVFGSRATLAQAIDRILTQAPAHFSGSSDHLVSEAFYFVDPEGNGLELYFDRNPDSWQWQDNRIVMGSSYLDPEEYIATHARQSGTPVKKMGHVHLKVGNIEAAKGFYVDALGLVITAESPGALFVSDGTYHHHLGMNTWESLNAGQRSDSLGLKSLELLVATPQDVEALVARLDQKNIHYQRSEAQVQISDPWGNTMIVGVK